MTAQRILVVDDETSILKIVAYALEQEGFEVFTAGEYREAESTFARVAPHLVILDVMLPGKSGLEIATRLRSISDVPIIMLSARTDEVDRILGLEFGADDYVTKPFSPRELVGRVRSVLRRSGGAPDARPSIVVGALHIDTTSRQVRVADAPVELTPTEYEILLHLARHPGTAFTRESLLAVAASTGPAESAGARVVDVHIHNLREKLEADPGDPERILTVRGFGYRLAES